MYLSVIIPAYNEEKRITKTLLSIFSYLGKKPFEWEIIVVNDGSQDKTAEVILDLKQKVKNLILINNNENHGKGYVVRQGLLKAQGKYRLFTDADNSTPISELDKLLPYLGKFDIVIASRSINGSKIKKFQPFLQKIFRHFV